MMKKYVFYTFEGFTESPTGKECENIQLLGFEEGKNQKDAEKNLIAENKWIKELDFDVDEIKSKQLLTDENKQDIKTVIDYLWKDEERHFKELDLPSKHIFYVLKRLNDLVSD